MEHAQLSIQEHDLLNRTAKSLIDEEEVTDSVVVSEREKAIVRNDPATGSQVFHSFPYAHPFLYKLAGNGERELEEDEEEGEEEEEEDG